ncbi:MAG TPA: methyltransferase domain-containing protein [Usitatibacter sp.]|jgi:demethylmenaquinone methyltransferase/2-methoxy-6-polyprenyl-1,4-benzoquinol methylase|nr:methyltransferase domain-containing protein [Usitatibacter sp.]
MPTTEADKPAAGARSTTPHLEDYYSKRAREYEQVYEKPERQRELEWLRHRVPELLKGRTVLEVACGTGYWTQYIAPAAKRVYAFDINEPVLEIAREKKIPAGKATFFKADAVTLDNVPPGCNAAFAGFWWSHVKKSDLAQFVQALSARIEPGSVVAILDNAFAPGSSTPISRTDAEGNTYQMRTLASGEAFEVLKNFPKPDELANVVRGVAREAHLESLTYYWLLVFTLK